MGTNFYWIAQLRHVPIALPTGDLIEAPQFNEDDPRIHIGKRSAAGLYCWDCRQTLCPGGEWRIHFGGYEVAWLKQCPKCGAPPMKLDGLKEGPAAVELGFAKPATMRPTGVRAAASFSWAQDPERVKAICRARGGEALIRDEYGQSLTGVEFVEMLTANCPIEFTGAIGRAFS